MAKSKSKRQRPASGKKAKPGRSRFLSLKVIILFVIVAVMGGYGLGKLLTKGTKERTSYQLEDLSSYQLKEKRPTLLAALFRGEVADAYHGASKFPKVYDQIHCYCKCEENFGHKGLLSCYVDKHAATWRICIDEALLVSEKYQEGYPVNKIRELIDKKFKWG